MTTFDQAPILEWRYSFSQPEIVLSDCIPPVAKKAFVALKAINKYHLKSESDLEEEKDIESYVLKTILLRTVERHPRDDWATMDLGTIFLEMLDGLHKALDSGHCSHFWIESINLLKDYPQERLAVLADKVAKIQKKPNEYVADNWLELTRCIQKNCCYCFMGAGECCGGGGGGGGGPCMIPCRYPDGRQCCTCPYDDIHVLVY